MWFLITVAAIFVVMGIRAFYLRAHGDTGSKMAGQMYGRDRCSFCRSKLKYAGGGQWAAVCRKCGRQQPQTLANSPTQSRQVVDDAQYANLGLSLSAQQPGGSTSPVRFSGCYYAGGFSNMKASKSTTLTISDQLILVQRPTPKLKSIYRLGTAWKNVKELRVDSAGGGSRLTYTDPEFGRGSVVLPTVPPLTLWATLNRVPAFQDRIPAEIRQSLG